jgi:hypothetical protein
MRDVVSQLCMYMYDVAERRYADVGVHSVWMRGGRTSAWLRVSIVCVLFVSTCWCMRHDYGCEYDVWSCLGCCS